MKKSLEQQARICDDSLVVFRLPSGISICSNLSTYPSVSLAAGLSRCLYAPWLSLCLSALSLLLLNISIYVLSLSIPMCLNLSIISNYDCLFIVQAKELEEKIRAFDLEKVAWDEEQREMEQSLRRKSLESNASKE